MSAPAKRQLRELARVVLGFAALAIGYTYPLAFKLSSLGRTDNADGQFAIWNVAWVARTLVVDPLNVFDANIFHPHRWTLAYSEANLGAGLIALPVYWLTRNPYAAFNFALLASFVLSGAATYYLVRYLTHDRRAAWISGMCFAFCPYLFGHVPHIQLLMAAGLPLTLLAFHRLVDSPTPGRAITLGLTMTLQTIFCAYYGVMAMLIVGFGVLFVALADRRWSNRTYWKAVAIAAGVAILTASPLALPYALLLQTDSSFGRSLDAAREYAATWRMYLASNSYLHAPLMNIVGRSGELLFPGIVAAVFGAVGAWATWRSTDRSRGWFYLSLAALAVWVSLGPDAGLYRALYATIPGFTLMRAPSRFGLIVPLALSVLAGIGIAVLLAQRPRGRLVAAALAVLAGAELAVPLRLTPVPPVEPAYQLLAGLPRGAVLDLPVYSHPFRFLRARYQLGSTAHWMPIVVAYSDFVPGEFMEKMNALAGFPSRAAFKLLERDRVRYVVFHMREFKTPEAQRTLREGLEQFAPYLRRLHADDGAMLYEIVGFPDGGAITPDSAAISDGR
jgi:hypothetical protein